MKAYLGNGSTATRILDLGTRWRWVVSFAPQPLYPQGQSPRYPLNRRLGRLPSRSGRGGEEKNERKWNTSFRGTISPVEIRIAYLPITSLERYRYIILLRFTVTTASAKQQKVFRRQTPCVLTMRSVNLSVTSTSKHVCLRYRNGHLRY
jgi:hypothetical protein